MHMLAVIKSGGKQYLVKEGDSVKIEKVGGAVNDIITFPDVLLLTDEKGESMKVGTPVLSDVCVQGTILEQGRGKKVTVIKFKPKVRYRRKMGHHQLYTKVQITKIE